MYFLNETLEVPVEKSHRETENVVPLKQLLFVTTFLMHLVFQVFQVTLRSSGTDMGHFQKMSHFLSTYVKKIF